MGLLRVTLLVLGFALVPALSRAEVPGAATAGDARTRAISLYDTSVRAYQAGRFDEAARLVRQAHELWPAPVLVYNLARAEEKAGQSQHALENYEEYLREEPSSPDRGAIEKTIASLKGQLDAIAAVQTEAEERRSAARHRRVGALVVAGVGAATLGVGLGFSIAAVKERDNAVASPFGGSAISDQSNAQAAATTANVCFAIGGVLALGGLAWAVLDRPARSPTGVRAYFVAGPGNLALAGRF